MLFSSSHLRWPKRRGESQCKGKEIQEKFRKVGDKDDQKINLGSFNRVCSRSKRKIWWSGKERQNMSAK